MEVVHQSVEKTPVFSIGPGEIIGRMFIVDDRNFSNAAAGLADGVCGYFVHLGDSIHNGFVVIDGVSGEQHFIDPGVPGDSISEIPLYHIGGILHGVVPVGIFVGGGVQGIRCAQICFVPQQLAVEHGTAVKGIDAKPAFAGLPEGTVNDRQLGKVTLRQPQKSSEGIHTGQVVFGLVSESISAVCAGDFAVPGLFLDQFEKIQLKFKYPVIEKAAKIQDFGGFLRIPQQQRFGVLPFSGQRNCRCLQRDFGIAPCCLQGFVGFVPLFQPLPEELYCGA